ncbi:E3 ubiquitin/ISG15 ligase TRIM25-like [Lithobates pipiens]
MASADLRDELKCSICLNLYKEPISLKCAHSFCWDCIVTALDTQEESGVYSCPECRVRYTAYPALEKNRKLCNIVECFKSAHQEEREVLCTYCDFPTPALKTCLLCEASFCEKHLSNHSKSPDHILTKPTTSFGERKCSVHQEVLKYYCTEDGACICMSCWVAGDHRGHQVDLLNVASEKKKVNLRESTIILDFERQEIPMRIRNLESHGMQEERKQIAVAGRVAELFRDIRKELDDVEERVLSEISRQKEQISQAVSDLIQQLENQQSKLSRKINQMKELCKLPDPLTVLKMPPNGDDISSGIEDSTKDTKHAPCINEQMISRILDGELHNFTSNLKDLMKKSQFSLMEKSNIVFDINTAHENIFISKKHKIATYTAIEESRSDGPNRFKSSQVLSLQSFTSGTHYWEVDVSEAEEWLIGVATETIERKIAGREFIIGYNDNSWALSQITSRLHARHRDTSKHIDSKSLLKTIGIYLDYEAGCLSFYQLCDPIRHLHTFTTTFTEPLYAAFYLFPNTSIRIIT